MQFRATYSFACDSAMIEKLYSNDERHPPSGEVFSTIVVAVAALFIRRVSLYAFPRRKSRILPMDRGWMRTGEDTVEERARGNGRALRNFTHRRSTGSQTRAMDEMLTRRETIDYSCQDRGRQVGREMAFLYQSGLRHRFCEAHRDTFIGKRIYFRPY